jgi:hypothetical protein
MINLDEDALICDFAETYHIYDYRSLPVRLAATLAAGLRAESRIRMKMSGIPVRQDTLLLASITDQVALFRYGFTEDAKKKQNRPNSVVAELLGEPSKKKQAGVVGFNTPEEFEAALARIRGE